VQLSPGHQRERAHAPWSACSIASRKWRRLLQEALPLWTSPRAGRTDRLAGAVVGVILDVTRSTGCGTRMCWKRAARTSRTAAMNRINTESPVGGNITFDRCLKYLGGRSRSGNFFPLERRPNGAGQRAPSVEQPRLTRTAFATRACQAGCAPTCANALGGGQNHVITSRIGGWTVRVLTLPAGDRLRRDQQR
jgi:hypothetical protein